MFEYEIVRVRQPFTYSAEHNEYIAFKQKLLDYLNAGYELVHSEDFVEEVEGIGNEFSFKLFIIRRKK